MKRKAFVLLSGGIDSTTCLYQAAHDFNEVEAVSIDYGQRHVKEMEYAAKSCTLLSIPHTKLSIAGIVPQTMLTDQSVPVPNISYADIKGVSPTYVPFRNGLMLSALTAFVQGQVKKLIDARAFELLESSRQMGDRFKIATQEFQDYAMIYFGAHAEDAANWAYPDCSPEFIGAMANAIYIGTYQTARLCTPLQWFDKEAVIRHGATFGVDWRNTWSCYRGEELHCGTCPTCRARRDGFKKAGIKDPTHYAAA